MLKNVLLVALVMLAIACTNVKKEKETPIDSSPEQLNQTGIERGRYLVTLMDCNTCHTPNIMTDKGPQPDMSRMLSGYPSDRPIPEFNGGIAQKGVLFPHPDLTASMGPWGISFAGNLTPHETGIGNWTFEQFDKAMRQGKYKGMENSRPILPPMPWQSYAKLTNDDLKAIFEYLKSIPAVENIVPAPIAPK